MNRRALGLFTALAVIWGLPYLFIKYAIEELDPVVIVWGRVAPSAIVLLIWAAYRGILKENLAFWKQATFFAFIEMVFPWWLVAEAERDLDSGIAGLLLATVPIFALLISVARGNKDVVTLKRVLGLTIGLSGVMVLALMNAHDINMPLLPVLMLMVTAFGYALGPIAINSTLGKADSTTLIGMSLAVVAIIYTPLLPFHLPTEPVSMQAIGSMIMLTAVCTVAAFVIFFKLIAAIGPMNSTLITYVNPVVAVILGVLILNEPLTPGLMIGMPLVLGGSWLAARG